MDNYELLGLKQPPVLLTLMTPAGVRVPDANNLARLKRSTQRDQEYYEIHKGPECAVGDHEGRNGNGESPCPPHGQGTGAGGPTLASQTSPPSTGKTPERAALMLTRCW